MNFTEFLKGLGEKATGALTRIIPQRTPTPEKTMGDVFQPQKPAFDKQGITKKIRSVETGGIPDEEAYGTIGRETGDLGIYQANPNTLKDWSRPWLGREYTKEEFLKDTKAQDEFFNQFLNVAERLNLTPEQTAIAWHRGWGELGSGKGTREERDRTFLTNLKEKMADEISQQYLKKFNQ